MLQKCVNCHWLSHKEDTANYYIYSSFNEGQREKIIKGNLSTDYNELFHFECFKKHDINLKNPDKHEIEKKIEKLLAETTKNRVCLDYTKFNSDYVSCNKYDETTKSDKIFAYVGVAVLVPILLFLVRLFVDI